MATIQLKNMSSDSKVKCKNCRHIVIEQCGNCFLTGHSVKLFESSDTEESCNKQESVWFLDEEQVPIWIMDRVKENNWLKGRLNCPKCTGRIGSFDFTSGTRCVCTKYVLPAIQVIKTKVDVY